MIRYNVPSVEGYLTSLWAVVIAVTLAVLLGCNGCVRPSLRGEAESDSTSEATGTSGAVSGDVGTVEFTGMADAEVTIVDSDGHTVFSRDVPCDVRLSPGSYTWEARFLDNQRTEPRRLQVMAGDDLRLVVEAPHAWGRSPQEATPSPSNRPAGAAEDHNKPWLSTEPIVPTDRPFGATKAGARSTSSATSSEEADTEPRSSSEGSRPRTQDSDAD